MPRVKRGVTASAKHKKVFEFTKAIEEEEKMSIELLPKVWIKHFNMHIAIEEIRKEIFEGYGFKGSMQAWESME